jgi:hypothetical protein
MVKASKLLAAGVLVWALMLVGNSCVLAQGKNHKDVLKNVNAILADINLKATDRHA